MLRYFIIYKPYQVVTQFSRLQEKKTLTDYFNLQNDVYPVGRLDYDSEGLLILTNDAQLNYRLLSPNKKHEREYWVQVEGLIDKDVLQQLEQGVVITVDSKPYKTLPSKAFVFDEAPHVPERNPPIRFRKNIPTKWINLTLTEGKNRQVRKMTASVGFPTLRLIRYRIERLTLQGLQPGKVIEFRKDKIYNLLFS